jgi:diphthamide synthase (EF-2-diphthine--ammonia ligase)
MVPTMRYEDPPHLQHDEASSVLERALSESETSDASAVIIGLVLFDDDQEYVEGWCRRIARNAV